MLSLRVILYEAISFQTVPFCHGGVDNWEMPLILLVLTMLIDIIYIYILLSIISIIQ